MIDMTAPVSVIIPCYLCRGSIERALVSVVHQTVPPREVVLVDDASPDDGQTVRELRQLADKYGCAFSIKIVLSERNLGPGSARNRGWEVATQPYVAFLDADDIWHARKIEIQYAWMHANGDFGLTGHLHILLPAPTDLEWPVSLAESDMLTHIRIDGNDALYSNPFATRTIMVRRDLPFRFQEEKRYAEDYLLWLQMMLGGVKAARIEMPLAAAFKQDFGVDGLSANLWRMECGELDCYRELYRQRMIGVVSLLAASLFSLMKFVRRVLLTLWRKAESIVLGLNR